MNKLSDITFENWLNDARLLRLSSWKKLNAETRLFFGVVSPFRYYLHGLLKEKLVLFINFWVCNVYYYIRESRGKKWISDSTLFSQLHIGLTELRKLCLNLCIHKWFRPARILVMSFIEVKFWQSICLNIKTPLLKSLQLSHFMEGKS